METIVLTEDLEIGKKTITEEGTPPYIIFDFFAKKGTTIRKHESGLVEIFYESVDGFVTTIPIVKHVPKINAWTEEWVFHSDDFSIGNLAWDMALKQTHK